MKTKVIIVYSPNLAKRRRVIIPDDDSEISVHQTNVSPGEAVHIGKITDYELIGPDAMLANHLGVQSSSDRCVIVNNGIVIGGCCADPAIDTHPEGDLVLHPTAVIGDVIS